MAASNGNATHAHNCRCGMCGKGSCSTHCMATRAQSALVPSHLLAISLPRQAATSKYAFPHGIVCIVTCTAIACAFCAELCNRQAIKICCHTMLLWGFSNLLAVLRRAVSSSSAHQRVQVMVWKTNFDRHLDDFVLTHVARGNTQLRHEKHTFAPGAAPAGAPAVTPAATGANVATGARPS